MRIALMKFKFRAFSVRALGIRPGSTRVVHTASKTVQEAMVMASGTGSEARLPAEKAKAAAKAAKARKRPAKVRARPVYAGG
jgi:hypothetical protein